MSQSRVVIRAKDLPTVERIVETTGVDSASDAISLLVSRYGEALISWWKSDVHTCSIPATEKAPNGVITYPQDPGVGLSAIEL